MLGIERRDESHTLRDRARIADSAVSEDVFAHAAQLKLIEHIQDLAMEKHLRLDVAQPSRLWV